jgi:hypothetical protein
VVAHGAGPGVPPGLQWTGARRAGQRPGGEVGLGLSDVGDADHRVGAGARRTSVVYQARSHFESAKSCRHTTWPVALDMSCSDAMPCRRAPASPPAAEEPLPRRTRSEVGARAPRSPCLPITGVRSRRAPWPLDHPGRGAKALSRRARELTARLLAPVVTRAQLTRRSYALFSAQIRGIAGPSSAEVRPGVSWCGPRLPAGRRADRARRVSSAWHVDDLRRGAAVPDAGTAC